MRGNFLVTTGIILIIAGAALLFAGYSSDNAAWAAIAWAAIIGGAISLLAGVGRKVRTFMELKPNNNADYAHAEIRTLIKSMGEMAAADGVIDPREVATIADIHERMLGISISTKEINKILSDFDKNDNIAETLTADRKMVNPAMKRMIIQSCYLVMVADGKKAGVELDRLHDIGDALGITKNEVDHLISIAAS
ncbi:MAG: TerB family tellurite resistance protein [Hyphomicrobiales bacterium]|nr:TerB family tellurite resistance protein [Hyphomicrobiales bacterium]